MSHSDRRTAKLLWQQLISHGHVQTRHGVVVCSPDALGTTEEPHGTCNAIYIAGSILQLEITMEFHRQLIRQHHLQSHLHCGNNPAVANHNGILSTTHARKTLDTPFTMRNRSENDPSISEHIRP